MTAAPQFAPGLAPIFAGWNVWDVWQKNDLDVEVTMVGLDRDRRLRVWVEDVVDAVSGVTLKDPLNPNPKHFNGDEVEILAGPPTGLASAMRKETVLAVPGALPLMLDGPATLRTVRFYNHGTASNMAWPHDANYLLDQVYTPSASNAVTNAPPPARVTEQVADAAAAGAAALGSGLKFLAVAVLAAAVVVAVVKAKKG